MRRPTGTSADATEPDDVPAAFRRIPRVGVWAWSFVGFVIALIIIVIALGFVSEIILPMTFAAVLAVGFRPLVGVLVRHKFKPSLAAGLVVLGLLVLMGGVLVGTVRGVTEQTDDISSSVDKALDKAADQTDALGIDKSDLDAARKAIDDAVPVIATGVLSGLVSGIGTLVAIAGGIILGALIMYYLLKDGTRLRRAVVSAVDPAFRSDFDDFIGDSCRVLRSYGRGRTVMSAIVSVFIGVVALADGVAARVHHRRRELHRRLHPVHRRVPRWRTGGDHRPRRRRPPEAAIMLVVVLAANLALENFVEPKVMGKSLDIHPLVVLVVTALGGLLGGIVGLILAVPAWVIASDAISRAHSRGVIQRVADRAQPAVEHLLDPQTSWTASDADNHAICMTTHPARRVTFDVRTMGYATVRALSGDRREEGEPAWTTPIGCDCWRSTTNRWPRI